MRSIILILFLLLASAAVGCSSADSGTALMQEGNKNNIQKLSNMYRLYQSRNNWQGPGSVDDLKEFIEGIDAKRLNMYAVDADDIDSLFVSERDGEEFKFRFKVMGAPMLQSPVVFEQTGKNGSRLVGFTSLPPQEVDDDSEYDDLWAGKFQSEKLQGPGR